MYNEQTNAHLIDSLLYCFFIYRSYMFQRQRVILRELLFVPAKLHKRVHTVFVVSFKKLSIRLLESLKH
jgi:hemerythrin